MLGSLRTKVAQEVKEHCRTNAALKSMKPIFRKRLLSALYGERGLLGFLFLYVLLALLILCSEILLSRMYPPIVLAWEAGAHIGPFLKDVTSYFLGAQVMVIGLLFPIAVALVTLIVQREDASSTISDIQVYYGETLAYRIGASGIALSIVLATQLLWPAHWAVEQLGLGIASQFKVLLTAVHIFWLVVNFIALWHFLTTSLSFIRPAERALMRCRYAAAISIPQDISERLTNALYVNAGRSLLKNFDVLEDDNELPPLIFGTPFDDWGEIEIIAPDEANQYLSDVWMRPLGWAVKRWWKRSTEETSKNDRGNNHPTLLFPLSIEQQLPEGGVICRRRGGVPLSKVEGFVIRHSFRIVRA